MFKIRMQGQYGGPGDKKLSQAVADMWRQYGFRRGIMRGYVVGTKQIGLVMGFDHEHTNPWHSSTSTPTPGAR